MATMQQIMANLRKDSWMLVLAGLLLGLMALLVPVAGGIEPSAAVGIPGLVMPIAFISISAAFLLLGCAAVMPKGIALSILMLAYINMAAFYESAVFLWNTHPIGLLFDALFCASALATIIGKLTA